jgi:RHS repeat-associated protein
VLDLSRKNVAFADLDGNGRVDLFSADQPLKLIFSNNGQGGFDSEPVVMKSAANVRLTSSSNRLMDLDGDGVTDLLETGRNHFLLYKHEKNKGWNDPVVVNRRQDMDAFPDLTLGRRGVHLADMKGDGLEDLVWLQSGQVTYWPYTGNGQWGDAVHMQHPPVLPSGYRDDRLLLTDLDGDGCTDIVYFDYDRTLVWINRAGNSFTTPIEIPFSVTGNFRIMVADFFGDGRPGFVWSSNKLKSNSTGYRFLRLGKGVKPYLLTDISNGMGGSYKMEYTTSSWFRSRDSLAGRPWLFQLPFSVHVVKTIRHTDNITGRSTVQSIQYHDGVFDGWQREFRGFTNVEFEMSGDESLPGTRQELLFFHGDPDHPDLVERERQRLLAGSLLNTSVFELLPGGEQLREESEQQWDTKLLESTPQGDIFFPFLSQIETHEHSRTNEPVRVERVRYTMFDDFGNPGRRFRESFALGQPENEWLVTEERFTYITDTSKWLVKLPVRSETYDGNGLLLGAQIRYYDGPGFFGLPEGNAVTGLTTRMIELRMVPSRMPAGYTDGRDFAAMGYLSVMVNGEPAWFSTSMAVQRDVNGNILQQQGADGNIVSMLYDADNVFPVQSTDILGNITRFRFNPKSGEPELITSPDGRTVRNEYDPIGRLAATYELTDNGTEELVKCWVTDIGSLPTSVTSIVPKTPGQTAAALKQAPDLAALDNVSVCKSVYDGFGVQIGEIVTGPEKEGNRQFVLSKRTLLNPKGSAAVQFPSVFINDTGFVLPGAVTNVATEYFYDYKGSTIGTFGPDQLHYKVMKDNFHIAFFEGDAAGEKGLGKPPAGAATRIERYDARSRLVKVEEMNGNIIVAGNAYELTADGLLQMVKDHTGATLITYAFAGPENPLRITHRDVGSRSYYRDANGKIMLRINPDGSAVHFSYDVLGRVTRIELEKPAVLQKEIIREMIYDTDPDESTAGRFLHGRLAVVREGANTIRYSYNRNGKIVAEKITADGVSLTNKWEYNLQGEVVAVEYPDGKKIAYSRDDCGSVSEVAGYANNFLYDADGSLQSYVLANGMLVNYERDAESKRIDRISATHGGNTLRSLDYKYDTVGNIISLRDQMAGSHTEWHDFSYDPLYRLTGDTLKHDHAGGTVIHTGTYQYDPAGNLLHFNDLQTQGMQYTDAAFPGRLTAVTHGAQSKAVQYDSNGNISAFGDLQEILYDGFDMISRVTMADKTIDLSYDHHGRRILKKVTQNGTTHTTRYAAGLYEQNGNGSVRHIFLNNMILASEKVSNGPPEVASKVFYMSDHHGTLMIAVDEAGQVLANQRYSAFGSTINNNVALDKYLGRDRDSETALQQLGARYYASFLGRFISPDWYVLENPKKAVRIPQAFNVYSYAVNNPLVFKDPSGMFIFFAIGVIMAIAYVAAIATAVAFGVGFIAGLVYGLATGKGWESLLRGLEAGLTTMVGMWLGAVTGMLAGSIFGLPGMIAGGIAGGIIGGLNGLVSGMTGIYDWGSWKGWAAFLSDSTWGLLGTALGLVVHTINIGWGNYRGDLSERQNRHVYESGVYLKSAFAFTMGNVISNAGQGGSGVNTSFIANHEELHIWQSRIFGPLFQTTYVVWAVVGFFVAFFYWLFTGANKNLGSLIETAAYYDNPFEYWAYNNDSNWPPSGANSDLSWG